MRAFQTLLIRHLVGLVVVAGAMPASAGYLRAQAGGTAYANANADPLDPAISNPMDTFQSGLRPPTGQIIRSDTVQARVRNNIGTADYSISATVGTLKVDVTTYARADRNNDGQEIRTFSSGQVYAWAEWTDELIVTGTAGVPVLLGFSVRLRAVGGVDFNNDSRNALDFRFGLPGTPLIRHDVDNLNDVIGYSHKQAISLLPGQYNISSYLALSATAVARFSDDRYAPLSGSYIDASNTANYFIDVLSDQGGYYTASGANLTTPIPEPQTWWMLAAGLALMSRLRVRHPG